MLEPLIILQLELEQYLNQELYFQLEQDLLIKLQIWHLGILISKMKQELNRLQPNTAPWVMGK